MICDTAWMVSVAMVTWSLQIARTMSSVAMVADENMYAGFFFLRETSRTELYLSPWQPQSIGERRESSLFCNRSLHIYLKKHNNTLRKGVGGD